MRQKGTDFPHVIPEYSTALVCDKRIMKKKARNIINYGLCVMFQYCNLA